MTHSPMDPTDAFTELGRIALGETSLDDVLQHVAEMAQRVLPVPVEVSVTLFRGEAAHVAASAGDLAFDLDEPRYAPRSGPCLDAATTGAVLSVPDLGTENRWPEWGERARSIGVGSSVSIGMPVQEAVVGALNVHARTPLAFDDDTITVLETLAAYAAVALANARLCDSTASLARQLHEATALPISSRAAAAGGQPARR
ncbi:GAF domain-containing protein [Micromonospora sp. DT231]|uniref:GAF domain-containing protein n=1 Tax=Micromonospora sp. DT231 TaxID=3416526 RepID=UPI003CE83E12